MATTAVTKYKLLVSNAKFAHLQMGRYPSKTRATIAAMHAGLRDEEYTVGTVTEYITGCGRSNELRREERG